MSGPGLLSRSRLPSSTRLRTRQTACQMAASSLPALAAGDEQVARRARVHVQTCLRCQAELAAYRRMMRSLRGLRHDRVELAPDTLSALLRAIETASAEHGAKALVTGRRVAYLGGMVAATAAAGAAGAVVWASRRRVGVFSYR